jgi:hypothetical protein
MANGFTKAREQYSQLLAELTSERDRIKSFSDTLFNDSDEIQSTQTQINQLIVNLEKLTTEATSKVSKINEKYNELLIDGEDGTLATATEIHNAKHDILAIKTELDVLINAVKPKQKALDAYYDRVFGVAIEGEEDRVDSLSQKLDKLIANAETSQTNWATKYQALHDQIEGLLPGATSAGLSSSYKDRRTVYEKEARNWSFVFLGSMLLMNIGAYFMLEKVESYTDAMLQIFAHSPLILPVIWLAIFASKRQSENKRLSEEYAHKESLAKSYEGYRKQVEALQEPDAKLQLTLLTEAVNAIAHNPSITLDGKHGDGTPLKEVWDAIAKLTPSKGEN